MAAGTHVEATGVSNVQPFTPDAVRELFSEGTLLDAIKQSSGDQDSQLQEIGIELHNSLQIDLLSLLDSEEFEALQGWHFFSIQQFYVEIIPHIKAPTGRLASCVTKLVQKGGSDGAANMPNGAFTEWCKKNKNQALELVESIWGGDCEFADYLGLALHGIGDLNKARDAAITFSDNRRLAALTALARIPHNTEVERSETVGVATRILTDQSDDALRATTLQAIISAFSGSKNTLSVEALRAVRNALSTGGEGTLYRAATILCTDKDALNSELSKILLQALLSTNAAHQGTIHFLDIGLGALIKKGFADQAIDFITTLLSQQKSQFTLKQFPRFSQVLLAADPDVLHATVVRWLNTANGVLCTGLEALFRQHWPEENPLDIEMDKQNLEDKEIWFVCRKAIGYFFLQPVVAASVLVSTLRTAKAPLAVTIQNLLFDPLLVNFGGKLRDYLSSLPPTDRAFASVQEVLTRVDTYLRDLSSTAIIKELRPSEHRRELQRARSHDQMKEAMKGAEEQSVMLKLVKRSTILHGRQTFSFIEIPGQGRRPVEMTLHSHSVGFELPRQEIADAVGLDEAISSFRLERLVT